VGRSRRGICKKLSQLTTTGTWKRIKMPPGTSRCPLREADLIKDSNNSHLLLNHMGCALLPLFPDLKAPRKEVVTLPIMTVG